MGRIKKETSPKHIATRPPIVENFVNACASIPLHQLPSHLESFPKRFKGDIYHWIDALNRFDRILDLFNREYGLVDGPQVVPFTRRLLLRGDGDGEASSSEEAAASNQTLDELNIPQDGDRILAESVLNMTRILLENCSNRGLYASTDRLNDLLNTTSLSLLEAALRIGHRVAQRYSAARGRPSQIDLHTVNHALLSLCYKFDLERMEKMSQPLPRRIRESTKSPDGTEVDQASVVTLTSLVADGEDAELGRREVCVQLISDILTPDTTAADLEALRSPTSPTSPTPLRMVENVNGDSTKSDELLERLKGSSLHDIVRELVSNRPPDAQFQAFQKVQLAWSLMNGPENWQRIVAIRLLALANLMHIYPETLLQQKILYQDSEEPRRFQLPYQLADLVHPPSEKPTSVPKRLQTFAMLVFEALVIHKHKASDVSTALSVNVNHGVLSYVVRKAVTELSSDAPEPDNVEDTDWREALYTLLHALPKNYGRATEGIASAGIVDLFVEALRYRTLRAELDHPRILNFLDTLVHMSRETFNSVVNASGLDAVSELLSFEVEKSVSLVKDGKGLEEQWRAPATDYKIPTVQQAVLRGLFKFVNHMMAMNGGNFDRLLRNLIESSQLLGSLRTIIQNPHTFGSSIWSGTLNVFSSFVNNEPTSYAAIAEAGLTKALLETITQKPLPLPTTPSEEETNDNIPATSSETKPAEAEHKSLSEIVERLSNGLLPSTEAISAAAQVFGAICLNDTGMQQVESSHVLDVFFQLFVSPKHVKSLYNASVSETEQLGATFDELARHYPRLKPGIVRVVADLAGSIAQMAHIRDQKQFGHPPNIDQKGVNGIQQTGDVGSPHDNDVEMTDVSARSAKPVNGATSNEDSAASLLDIVVVFSNFLWGFFTNPSLCTPFAETNGIEHIIDIAVAPFLPFDFGVFGVPQKLVRVVQVLVDQKPHLTLPSLISRALKALRSLKPFVDHPLESSYLQGLVQRPESTGKGKLTLEPGSDQTSVVRAMAVTEMLCHVLTKSHTPPSSRSASSSIHQVNLTDKYTRLIDGLGRLQTKCVWENMLMKTTFAESWSKTENSGSAAEVAEVEMGAPNGEPTLEPHSNLIGDDAAVNDSLPVDKTEQNNFLVLRQLFNSMPSAISNLFQSIGKVILPRRMFSDAYPRQNTVFMADHIAQALLSQLSFSAPTGTDSKAVDYYRMVSVSLITRALMDGRTDTVERPMPQILTLILISFKKKGGLSLLATAAQSFFDNVIASAGEGSDDSRNRHDYASEGLKSVLQFFAYITNSKVVLESYQSTALTSRSDQRDRPEFFLPNQFLVEIRSSVMKSISALWESEQLESAKPFIVKSLLDIVNNILEATGEHNAFKRTDKLPSTTPGMYKVFRYPSPDALLRLNESYDRELVLEAVYRCNGQLGNAQEYCAAYTRNPQLPRHRIPAYDYVRTSSSQDPESSQSVESENSIPPIAQIVDDDSLPWDQQPSRPFESSISDSSGDQAEAPGAVVTVEDLDDQRSEVRDQLMDRCLTILGLFDELTFELASLLLHSVAKHKDPKALRQEIAETLVQSLVSYEATEENEKQIAASAHLLGIVLQEPQFFEVARDTLIESFESLLTFIAVSDQQQSEDSASWVPQVLLIIERILSEDAQPRQVRLELPDPEDPLKERPLAEAPEPLISHDQKDELLTRIIDILHRVGKKATLGLALARVTAILTRDRIIAARLGQKKNMQRLFVMIKQLSGSLDEKLQSAFMITLRHIVEDEATVQQIMRSEIRNFLETQPRQTDTTTYTRNLNHAVLRNPEQFIEATSDVAMIARYQSTQGPQNLTLKAPAANPTPADSTEQAASTVEDTDLASTERPSTLERVKTSELKPPVVENPDGVIHYLLSELFSYKDVDDVEQTTNNAQPSQNETSQDVEMTLADGPAASGADESNPLPDATEPKGFKAEEHPIFIYRCFILQCLCELLRGYNRTKVEFINFSRKADPQAATPSKPRASILNYLFNVLIPTGIVEHAHDIAEKKKSATSNWAINVVVSLCARTNEKPQTGRRHPPVEEDEPDLLFVRRFVLEHALRTYKEANSSSDSFGVKYAKLLAFADLFNRMLVGRQSLPPYSRRQDSPMEHMSASQKGIAKIMFEKNFIAALTGSISDIDLNVAGSHRIVKYILRPLKMLTHTAVELSQSSDIGSSPGQTDEDEISSATSNSEAGEDREDTPDLFRNSTLGMFDPQRDEDEDDSSSDSEGDEDEDMYGEDFDENPMVAQDDVLSDEDEDMEEDMDGQIEGFSGDIQLTINAEADSDDDDDDEEDEDGEGYGDESGEESDVDHDEDMDDEMEALAEVTGDDENASDGQLVEEDWIDNDDEGDDVHYEGIDDPEVAYEIGGAEPGLSESDSHSEEDGMEPPFDGAVLNEPIEEDLISGADHDGVVQEDSEEDEDEEDEGYLGDVVHGGPGIDDGTVPSSTLSRSALTLIPDDDTDMPRYMFGMPPHFSRRAGHLRHQTWNMPRDRGGLMSGLLGRLHDSISGLADSLAGGYRAHRPGGSTRNDEEGLNPLLSRASQANSSRRPPGRPQLGRTPVVDTPFGRLPDFASLGRGFALAGGNPASYLSDLFNVLGQPPPLPMSIQHHGHHHHHHNHHHLFGPGGEVHLTIPIGSSLPRGLEEFLNVRSGNAPRSSRNESSEPADAVEFSPMTTIERWREEARLIFGGTTSTEKCLLVVNAILMRLVPAAMEANRLQQIKAEQLRKEEAEKAMIRAEAEEKERKEREEREAAEREAEAANEAARLEEERLAAEAAGTSADAGDEPAVSAMEGVESTSPEAGAEQADAAESSASQPRVFTNIRGQNMDITNLGIDLAYLEALPDDMREEVITMQLAEQRSQANAGQNQPGSVNLENLNEFMEALPADMRDDILQHEAQERRRRERQEARRQAQEAGEPTGPEELDAANFMATLDPGLRQTVLAEMGDDMLAQLPPDVAAEARALNSRRRAIDPHRFVSDEEIQQHLSRRLGQDHPQRQAHSKVPRRPVIQMVDKAAIATLLRLMFSSLQSHSRQGLNAILRNVCYNHQTRGEVVTGLLSILQDGSIDAAATERTFAQLTLRSKQAAAPPKTPTSTKKLQQEPNFACTEASPTMVTAHCLNALVYLTTSMTHLPKFFITEHDYVGITKPKYNRKGKARETNASKYPINALLSLLDRRTVVDNTSVNEQLAGLLEMVTRPLIALKQMDKSNGVEAVEEEATIENEAAQAAANATEPDDHQLPDAPAENVGQSDQTGEAGNSAPTTLGESSTLAAKAEEKATTEAKKPLEPPEIPEENLRLVVNILTARDCSSKTFQNTLTTINNMSNIPGARQIFGQELVERARALGQTIQKDLTKLIGALQSAENEMDAQGFALANFSPAGSDQSKLNRILTALDYLFDSKTSEEANGQDAENLLGTLYDDASFSAVWTQLSASLSATQQENKYFFNVATILLPLVEALMVVCKRVNADDAQNKASQSAAASPVTEMSLRNVFFTFTNKHKKVLNDLVRHNPKLMSGSFSVLVKNSSVLEFDNKRNYFTRRVHQRTSGQRHYAHPTLQLNIRRDQVFTDSFQALCFKKPEEVKYGKLNIRFHNEEGVDAGGVTREWFQVLARQMFDASYALFNPVASDRTTFHPNSLSGINELHLQYFKFIGRIIGKALYENRVLDCHFSRAVYKRILGKSVSMKDMETLDLEFTKSLQWMLDNDITDVLTETFSVEKDNFGITEVIDLIEDGRNVPVTEENKQEYVRLLVEYRLTGSVQEQLEAFLGGFHDIVPAELISIFDEGELELLISGMPDVDIDDWKTNTDYHNYNAGSPQIQWFWRAVRSFDKEERAKLLQFVTGTGKVPLNGFKELEGMNGFTRFSIHKDYGDKERLPSSHTCFNQLDLPEYESYETLRKQLYTAMTTGNEFFGFA